MCSFPVHKWLDAYSLNVYMIGKPFLPPSFLPLLLVSALTRNKYQQLEVRQLGQGERVGQEDESLGNIYLKGHNLQSCIFFPERLLSILLSFWIDKKDFRSMGFILLNINMWSLNIHLRDKEQYHWILGGKSYESFCLFWWFYKRHFHGKLICELRVSKNRAFLPSYSFLPFCPFLSPFLLSFIFLPSYYVSLF